MRRPKCSLYFCGKLIPLMSPIDYLGFAGVSMILLAFFLNLRNILTTDHLAYILLNTVGAALACLASILMQYLPFVILEGVWLAVSGQGADCHRRRRAENPSRRRAHPRQPRQPALGCAGRGEVWPRPRSRSD